MAISTTRIPETWNMTLYKGDNWPPYSFRVVDESGAGVDMSGQEVLMQVKHRMGDSDAVKELTHLSGFKIAGDLVTFDESLIVDMPAGAYNYDIELTINGKKYTQYAGLITVKQDTSR